MLDLMRLIAQMAPLQRSVVMTGSALDGNLSSLITVATSSLKCISVFSNLQL